eukprot:SAG11_NODE_31948_length_287_cov_1.893617_1_plen_50_part_01
MATSPAASKCFAMSFFVIELTKFTEKYRKSKIYPESITYWIAILNYLEKS